MKGPVANENKTILQEMFNFDSALLLSTETLSEEIDFSHPHFNLVFSLNYFCYLNKLHYKFQIYQYNKPVVFVTF